MSKQIIGIIIAVAVIAGGAFAFWQIQDDEPELAQEITDNGITQEDIAELSLVGQNMAGASYMATITGNTPEGPLQSTLEFDGEGSYSFSSEQAGQSVQFIVTPEATYSCQGNQCFEFPRGQEDDLFAFNIDDFTYEEDDLTEFADIATRIGEGPCPAGTCDVWEIVDRSETTRLYIDTSANRISQATGSGDDGEFSIVYDYRDVTITPPENVQPMPDFPQ